MFRKQVEEDRPARVLRCRGGLIKMPTTTTICQTPIETLCIVIPLTPVSPRAI